MKTSENSKATHTAPTFAFNKTCSSDENSGDVILGGIISVEAAIKGANRAIKNIYIDVEKYKKRDRKITRFVSFLKLNNLPFCLCERDLIDGFVNEHDKNGGSTHGGVVAVAGPRKYADLHCLSESCAKKKGFLVFLDGVEDPFNFGYSLRSLYAFGASGVVVPKRNWSSAAGVCARASAGASELIPIACAPDLETEQSRRAFLADFKKRGFTIGCAAVSYDSVPVQEYDYPMPFLLFIGGEKRGISPEFVEGADALLHIPYAGKDVRYSLPTADAASLFGFTISTVKKI